MVTSSAYETEERRSIPLPVRTYAEPLSGLRVSWGAVVAGAVAALAVALILWALALAITMSATNATGQSLKGSFITLWICGMVTTVVGALVGGMLAGYLPGNPSRAIGAIHGFLAWALAFLVVTGIQLGVVGAVTRTATESAVTAAGAATEAAGGIAGGVAGGAQPLDRKAHDLLRSLGYSEEQASQMSHSAQAAIQEALGNGPGATPAPGAQPGAAAPTAPSAPSAQQTVNAILNRGAGLSWAWFGTWVVAAVLAVGGGMAAGPRLSTRRYVGATTP
jgi:hypothetical protein